MRILVTGSRGFVGRRLVRRLEGMGLRVARIERESPANTVGSNELASSFSLDSANAGDAVADRDIRVVHLGWDVGRRNDWAAQANCVVASARLFSHLGALRPRQLIVLGSAEEYGARGGVLAEDDAPSGPLSAYGWAKAATRNLLESWRESATAALWLRPFLVYGPGQTGNMMVPTAVRAATERTPAAFSDGTQRRDFVHIEDVVDAIVSGLVRVPDGMNVLNLGTGEPVAVRDFLEEIALRFDAKGLFTMGAIARRSGEPDLQVANAERAGALIGWRPRIRWRDGVTTLLDSSSLAH